MKALPSRLILDTNVWLDCFMKERAGHDTALELVLFAERNDIDLFFAVHSAVDISYLVEASFKKSLRQAGEKVDEALGLIARQYAWSCVQNLQEIATPVGADASDFWWASKLHATHPDFEDDMILAAARRANVDCLVTSDGAFLRRSTVASFMPQDMLDLLKTLYQEVDDELGDN